MAKLFDDFEEDLILYYGGVSRAGYDRLSEVCRASRNSDTAYLILGTTGGDPHAGYRMARCMRHFYKNFKILIGSQCKSAGTLVAIGAHELIVGDRGELGPLDIQLTKPDEIFENSSGLDLPQAMDVLRAQAMNGFSEILYEARMRGLSTKAAVDVATKLTSGMLEPIYAQIDPVRLGEMARANAIGHEYATRLNESSKNLKGDALTKLISSYPSHSFVIDRKEAAILFERSRAPDVREQKVLDLIDSVGITVRSGDPIVFNWNHKDEAVNPEERGNSDAGTDQNGAEAGDNVVQIAQGTD